MATKKIIKKSTVKSKPAVKKTIKTTPKVEKFVVTKTKTETKALFSNINTWKMTTGILVVVLLGLFLSGHMFESNDSDEIGIDVAKETAANFIQNTLLSPGITLNVDDISKNGELYELNITITANGQEQKLISYMTLDGKTLFPQGLAVVEGEATAAQPPATAAPTEYPKVDKPEVDLYVMSFCPYGVQAENQMMPVVDALKDVANINVRFIANVNGDTVESVQSLHGAPEAKEDLRQVCVQDMYDTETFWNYVEEINSNCYSIYRNEEQMETCWKAAAETANVDVAKVEECAYSATGIDLLKADGTLTNEFGVSGSPTIIINGMKYNGARTADAFQAAICSSFNVAPEACGGVVETVAVEHIAEGSC